MSEKCVWEPTVDRFGYPMYASEDCNLDTDLISGHPYAEGYNYCPYCRREIEVKEEGDESLHNR